MKNILPTIQAFFARAKFWRKAAPETDASPDDAAPSTPPAGAPDLPPADLPPRSTRAKDLPPAAERTDAPDMDEAPPKRPLSKRLLDILIKKIVWIPAAALLLIALTVTATVGILHTGQKEGDKALQALQAEKSKLEAENRKLKEAAKQPAATPQAAIIPAPAKPPPPTRTAKPDPAFDVPDSASSRSKPASAAGDCLITGKDGGDSLKRCIEAFNHLDKR